MLDLYGYNTAYGYRGRVNKEKDIWILFESEDAYVNYMYDMHMDEAKEKWLANR